MVKQNKNNKISVFGVLTEHFTRCLDETLDKHNRYRSLIFDEEVFRAGGVEVAEVGVVVDAYMRTGGKAHYRADCRRYRQLVQPESYDWRDNRLDRL